jgi:predicted protein tyrosine phosphatase
VVPVVMVQDIVFLELLDIMLVVEEEDLKVIQEEFHFNHQEDKVVEVTVDMDLLFPQINLLEIMEKQTLEVAVVEEDKEILQIHSQQPQEELVVPES